MKKREVLLLAFAEHPEQREKCWISLSECNFSCKGCAALSKKERSRLISSKDLAYLVFKSSRYFWGKIIKIAVITGDEITLNPESLLSLISNLKDYSVKYFELSTNSFMIDEDLLKELIKLKLPILVKMDLKAYDEKIYKEYSGKSEVRVDESLNLFEGIDRRAKLIIKNWKIRYLTINPILTSK
ncbi:MAG: hypothetical protein DRI28_07145 [Caldiserica bacterium]|nr:MAG: hypothetical protein DRI28_07145 [Caldisericota bacterium]